VAHDFVVESRTGSAIQIRHIVEGHHYAFQVDEGMSGRRVLGRAIIREGTRGDRKGKFFLDAARLFAEREARIADLID
jgi:hypothetical protein